jgi:folate-binding protein YgfZ
MQHDWFSAVISQDFRVSPQGIVFSEMPRPLGQQLEKDFVTLLPQLGVLGVEGSDAAKFLQGQLSCDLDAVTMSSGRRGAHCTPKGRAIASFLLTQQGPQVYTCILPSSVLKMLQQSLAKYIVFSKAELRDSSESWAIFGLAGVRARDFVLHHGDGDVPAGPLGQVRFNGGFCLQLEGPQLRYMVYLPRSEARAFWQTASQALALADSAAWQLLDIRRGIGNIVADTSEMFIPQMLNFDKLNAISFKKGCYTGQEVVARAHYRGAVKRRMRGFRGAADVLPTPGNALGSDGSSGTIVSAVASGIDTIEGLVVLAEDQSDDQILVLDKRNIPIVTTRLDYLDITIP